MAAIGTAGRSSRISLDVVFRLGTSQCDGKAGFLLQWPTDPVFRMDCEFFGLACLTDPGDLGRIQECLFPVGV